MRMHAVITGVALCLAAGSVDANTPRNLNAFSEGERLLYTRIIEAFRKTDLKEVNRQKDLLAKNYPRSVHLDNAYYLSGVLEFQKSRLGEAVRAFSVVIDRYPLSNKRSAALFAKAMTYAKLGLKAQETQALNQVVNEYPGSQEAQRAWMQLKVSAGEANNDSRKR